MQFRTILEGVFASPITVISSVVIIVCAGVLVVSISSTINNSHDMDDASFDVTGEFPASSTNNSLYLQQSDSVPRVTINREQSSSDRDTPKSTYQKRNQDSSSSRGYTNRDGINSDSRNVKEKHNNYKRNTGNNNFSELSTTGNAGSSDVISHEVPTLNFSNSNSSIGSDIPGTGATSTTSNNESSATNSSSAGSATTTTSGVEADLESEKVFPVSSESTVKIDLDETQTISCRPVTENGPPCMCTMTITDANGSFSEVINNCN